MDGTVEALGRMARLHGAHGTTSLLATTTTEAHERVMQSAARRPAGDERSPARSLIGRVLASSVCTSKAPTSIRSGRARKTPLLCARPTSGELGEIVAVLEEGFRLVTLAPELPGERSHRLLAPGGRHRLAGPYGRDF